MCECRAEGTRALVWVCHFISPKLPSLQIIGTPGFGFKPDGPEPRPQTEGRDEFELFILVKLIYRYKLGIVLYQHV